MIGRLAAIAPAAGLAWPAAADAAQELVSYSWRFTEVIPGTNAPVANPNGIVDLHEGARLELTATITPGIGSPVTFTRPPAPGVGTIAGLGSIFFDLAASANAGPGSWCFFGRSAGFALGGPGTSVGNNIVAAQAGQFILPGLTANSNNPIVAIWRATWNPTDWTPRIVTFTSAAALAAGTSHSSILAKFADDENGDPVYIPKFAAAQFGSIQIPIVPAPGLALPVFLIAFAMRTRRRPGGVPA